MVLKLVDLRVVRWAGLLVEKMAVEMVVLKVARSVERRGAKWAA